MSRTDRKRRIMEWHIGNCPECSQYLKAYRGTFTPKPDDSGMQGAAEAGASENSATSSPAIHAVQHERPDDDFGVFAASPLFRGLSTQDLTRIYSRGEKLEVDSGTAVIEEGRVNSGLFVVLSGELQVSLPAGPERYGEVALATRRPPDCFGEYAFVDYKMASASVTATHRCRLFKIGFDELDGFIDADAELARAIYENVLLLVVSRLRAKDAELDLFRSK